MVRFIGWSTWGLVEQDLGFCFQIEAFGPEIWVLVGRSAGFWFRVGVSAVAGDRFGIEGVGGESAEVVRQAHQDDHLRADTAVGWGFPDLEEPVQEFGQAVGLPLPGGTLITFPARPRAWVLTAP